MSQPSLTLGGAPAGNALAAPCHQVGTFSQVTLQSLWRQMTKDLQAASVSLHLFYFFFYKNPMKDYCAHDWKRGGVGGHGMDIKELPPSTYQHTRSSLSSTRLEATEEAPPTRADSTPPVQGQATAGYHCQSCTRSDRLVSAVGSSHFGGMPSW